MPTLAKRWRESGLHDDETLPEALARAARDTPEVFMHFPSDARPSRLNLRDLEQRARRMASALQKMGVAPDDVVAVQLPNWAEVAIAYNAVAMLGAVILPIVHIYGPHETDWILRASGARLYISPDRWGNIDFLERAEQMPALASMDRIVVGEEIPPGASDWNVVEESGDPDFQPEPVSAERPLMVVYTSGTTSDPKGVLHTHQTLMTALRNQTWSRDQPPYRMCLHLFPAGHIGGASTLLATIPEGKSAIIVDRWDPVLAAKLIEEYEVDRMTSAPIHVAGLLDLVESGEFSCSSLRTISTGGAGVPPALLERADRVGWRVARGYGSSEHPYATNSLYTSDFAVRAYTDGAPCRRLGSPHHPRERRRGAHGRAGRGLVAWPRPVRRLYGSRPEPRRLRARWLVPIRRRGRARREREPGDHRSHQGHHHPRRREPLLTRDRGSPVPPLRHRRSSRRRHARPQVWRARLCLSPILTPGAEEPDLEELLRHFDALGAARQKTPERTIVVDEFPRTPAGKVKKHELRAQL